MHMRGCRLINSTFFKDTIDLASTDGRIRIELDQWEPTTIADYITLSAIPRLTELPVRMSLTDQINIFHFTDFVGNGKLWDVLRMCVARAASPKHLLQIAVQSNDDAYLIDFALRTLYGRLMNAGYDIRQLCVAVHACRLAFQGLPPRYTAALGDRLIRVYSTPTPQTPGWMGWEWLDSCAEMEGFIAAVRGDGEERWFNKKRKASQEV